MNAARILHDLASCLERREQAQSYWGTPCPKTIRFLGADEREPAAYADNPTLLNEIKKQIRLEWAGLRERAFQRMDDEIASLKREAVPLVAPDAAETEGAAS